MQYTNGDCRLCFSSCEVSGGLYEKAEEEKSGRKVNGMVRVGRKREKRERKKEEASP